jgi:cytochrome c oxidase assembly protein subunit 17
MGAAASAPAPAGASAAAAAAAAPAPDKPKKKICCACPETKAPRDACTAEHGPESAVCAPLIEAHKKCLRAEGFNVV